MKEFVEKLIERLEEDETKWSDIYNLDKSRGGINRYADGRSEGAIEIIGIVKQLAEEYNNGWIPVAERLPMSENEVLIMANRKYAGCKEISIITIAMYEDGTIRENDSIWCWEDIDGEFDEEENCYIIPKGWWESRQYNPDDVYNNAIDDEVIAWMPLPEPYNPEEPKQIPTDHFMERFNRVM